MHQSTSFDPTRFRGGAAHGTNLARGLTGLFAPEFSSSVPTYYNTMKWGVLATKFPARWGSFSKIPEGRRPKEILLNDPNRVGVLIANAPKFHGITLQYHVCQNSTNTTSGDVKPGRISPNTTRFEVTGGSISANEF